MGDAASYPGKGLESCRHGQGERKDRKFGEKEKNLFATGKNCHNHPHRGGMEGGIHPHSNRGERSRAIHSSYEVALRKEKGKHHQKKRRGGSRRHLTLFPQKKSCFERHHQKEGEDRLKSKKKKESPYIRLEWKKPDRAA